MKTPRALYLGIVAAGVAVLVTGSLGALRAQSAAAIHVGPTDIGGVVTSAHGAEAGAWVIATTDDLPTKYAKIVVTDDQGRYLIPDLPKAHYTVWSRGYGLVDSAKVAADPGRRLNLSAVLAPSAAAAAQYYPAVYWFAMLKIPPASDFPGTGPAGNGIGKDILTQHQWVDLIKTDGCVTCHTLGNKATRTIPAELGTFSNGAAAWGRRVQSGQASGIMLRTISALGPRALQNFGDWTDRIKAGELPFDKPARPQGVERNVVITEWDWAEPTTYLHDEISTDKRNPRVNAYGRLYGSPEESTDNIPILDPVHNTASFVKVPVLDPKTPNFGGTSLEKPTAASPYWGMERIWSSQTTVHNPMFDEQGRLWVTARLRPADDPAFCSAGSANESAQLYPLKTSSRQSAMYDPKTGKWTLANVCFNTHHLTFASNTDDTLWYSAGGGDSNVLGWLDVKKFLETGDAAASQGWTPLVLDTAGTGVRTDYVQPNEPVVAGKDKRINGNFYGVAVDPADGTVWGSVLGVPGSIMRVNPGPDPARTALTEIYELPMDNPKAKRSGYSPRGMDIDRSGVVYAPLASGSLARFDRRNCAGPLNGPNATGQQCPEGWTITPFPGPQFNGLNEAGSAEAAYYTWVDQFNTGGLGFNVPYATGNENEAVLALVNGKWVTLRIPYPMGFYAKNVDGRIDDASTGWKGRGLWTTYGSRAPFHMETGKGTRPKVLHLQMRPNPLAD